MTLPLMLGLLAGLGALVTWRALVPPLAPLDARLRRFTDADLAPIVGSAGLSGVLGRTLGARAGRLLSGLGLARVSEADLRLAGRSLDQHLGEKVLLALFGLTLPSLTALLMNVAGVSVSFSLPLGAGLFLAAVFLFVPDLSLRAKALEQRKAFRHALGSFLDLVVIGLAGGAGVESALVDASTIGGGWPFAQLRQALEVTAFTGETPWSALGRLGRELDVPELEELAASVSLAGSEGARVRESLAAKAASLRSHALSEVEAGAQAATERMALPVVLLFVGFLLLVGYPAVDAVLTGI